MSKEGKREREEEDEDEEDDDDEVDDLPVTLTCLFLSLFFGLFSPFFALVVPLFLQPPQDMNIGGCCIH